jgi:hypothetical protein
MVENVSEKYWTGCRELAKMQLAMFVEKVRKKEKTKIFLRVCILDSYLVDHV